jgi:uncharacterized integral membrane protein
MNISLLISILALIVGCVFYDELYKKEVENMSNLWQILTGFILSVIFVVGFIIYNKHSIQNI